MALAVHTFTISGRDLLSAASATKTIDIDHIYCIESEVSQADILSQPKTYFSALASNKLSARVTSAGEDPNNPGRSRIVVEIGITAAASADVTMKTLVVCAHAVDAGVDGEEKTFYGISDPVGLVIPYSTSIPIKQNLSFSFAFTDESEITVDGDLTSYLLESEVGRFVTTHKAGEPTEGEGQTVQGYKQFVDGIGTPEIHATDEDGGVLVAGTLYPEDDSTNIGTPENFFGYYYGTGVKIDAIEELQSGGIALASDLFPSGVGINIGTGANPFASMNAHTGAFQTAYCGALYAIVGGSITLSASLIPEDEFVDLGTDLKHFGTVYSDNFSGVIPDVHTRTGGTPGTDNPIIPVGAFVMLNLVNNDSSNFSSGANAVAGEIVSSSGGELADGTSYDAITVAQYEHGSAFSIKTEYTTNASRGVLSTGMNFRIICGCHNTTAANMLTVLAMRIADSV